MSGKLDAYDLLGFFVPGVLVLGWLPFCFPEIFAGAKPLAFPDGFLVILLTALSIFVGQLMQAIASLLEPTLYKTFGGRPSDTALEQGLKGFFPQESAIRIEAKLKASVGQCEPHSLFLYAMQLSDGQDQGRARRFNALYAYHRALLVLVLFCSLTLAASVFWGQVATWSWEAKLGIAIASLFLLILTWNRTRQRACYYVREVLFTAERILDEREKKDE